MKTKCPACGASASLDVLLSNEGARAAVTMALQLPAPLGKLLVQYLGLFRPASRELSFDRVATLLGELLPMIQAGQIERAGRTWAAPVPAWKEALEQMLVARDKLQLPMKSHGYLLEIIAGMGSKAEAFKERAQEEQLRHRPREEPPAAPEEKKPKSWDERKKDAAPHIQALTEKFKTGGKRP